jgi:hypothetical protein
VPVTERDKESAGDYGYDLAHEETGRVTPSDDTTGSPMGQAPPRTSPGDSEDGGPSEDLGDEDLGYDEAHDF